MRVQVHIQQLRCADAAARSASTAADLAVHTVLRQLQLCRAKATTLHAVMVSARQVLRAGDAAAGLASGEYHWCDDVEPTAKHDWPAGPELLYCPTAACEDRKNHRGVVAAPSVVGGGPY
jgi:hypothetical protein